MRNFCIINLCQPHSVCIPLSQSSSPHSNLSHPQAFSIISTSSQYQPLRKNSFAKKNLRSKLRRNIWQINRLTDQPETWWTDSEPLFWCLRPFVHKTNNFASYAKFLHPMRNFCINACQPYWVGIPLRQSSSSQSKLSHPQAVSIIPTSSQYQPIRKKQFC